MADVSIRASAVTAAPMDYKVPGSQEIAPKAVTASMDGTSAAVAWFPCLQLLDPAGNVMFSAVPSSSVAAGASADVSWFPHIAAPAASSSGGSGPAILFDHTVSPGPDNSIGTPVGGIAQTHTDLLVVTSLRSNEAITGSNSGGLSINNNTANAKQNYMRVFNTTTSGNTGGSGAQGVNILALTGSTADASVYGDTFVYIPNYTSSNIMTCLFLDGVAPANAAFTNWIVDAGQGRWNNQTGPITQITAVPNLGGSGQFVAGSRMTIYGIG